MSANPRPARPRTAGRTILGTISLGIGLVVALVCLALWVAALTAWLLARRAEAAAGMPPGVGLTGMAVLRPQLDPRTAVLVHHEGGGKGDGPTVLRHLKAAGQWTLGIAEKIGVGLAVEASKRARLGGS